MRFENILILVLVPLVICQSGFNKNFQATTKKIKQFVIKASLIGKWKLLQDSNFVINKKLQMINQAANEKVRNNQKLSFISSINSERETQAFFDFDKQAKLPRKLYMELYDGKYYSNSTLTLEIDLKGMEASKREDNNINLWSSNRSIIVVCMLIRNQQVLAKVSVQAKIEIYTNVKQNELEDKNWKIFVKFQSNSLSFYAQLQYIKQQYDKIILIEAIFTVLLLAAVIKFKPKRSVYSISEWMILQAFSFLLMANWILLKVSLQKIDTKLKFVGLCAFINICIGFFFLRNYEKVLQSFKSKWQKLGAFTAIVIYLLLCNYYQQSINFWIYQSFCFLILQINHSYSIGGRGGLSMSLITTFIFMRFPFFYYRFYSPQITRQSIDLSSIGVFLIINIILITFTILQKNFGSRFIIPKQLIPDYFNYFQKYSIDDQNLNGQCPICTGSYKKPSQMRLEDEQQLVDDQQIPQQSVQNTNQINLPTTQKISQVILMKTPCGHIYHNQCLKQWMDKRLICPYCRNPLPPSEKQREDSYCC